jgi:glycosyltransferase involved in cell wall biosynthesis
MTLAIISHTEHYTLPDGTLVGWSPTVNEVNYLLGLFDTIYHLAMHYEGPAPKSVMPYISDRIQFIALPAVGGPSITAKLSILANAPRVMKLVAETLTKVDYFQLRTPTGIAVFLIPYLSLFAKNKGWYKYAGNWNQQDPPLGYALQRWMLKQQRRKVTINGVWPQQPPQCLSFENPCLTEVDLTEGISIGKKKSIDGLLTFCFVGRLEREKGVDCILESLALLSKADQERIATVHFVGEGLHIARYLLAAQNISIPIIFHGSLSRSAVFEIYKVSHAILMPTTASEGFPKVLAEAMNFGCIPIVSDMSSIGQYIQHAEQGFLLSPVSPETLVGQLQVLLKLEPEVYVKMLTLQRKVVNRFTFEHYIERLQTQLLT